MLHAVVAPQEVQEPRVGFGLVLWFMEMVERLVHLLHRAEGPLHLALRARRHAPAVLPLWQVGAYVHLQIAHHPPKDLTLRDGTVIEVEHLGDSLKGEAVDGLWCHGVEQKAQCGFDIFAIDTVVFLVGHAAAIVHHAEEHQGRWPSAGFYPSRGPDLLEVRGTEIKLPTLVARAGLKPHRRRR